MSNGPESGLGASSQTGGIALDQVPTPVSDLGREVVDGELLLYHPWQTRAVYLNSTAALIWGLCDGRRAVNEIIDLLSESYPDAGTALAEEVTSTLQRLREDGVLRFVNNG